MYYTYSDYLKNKYHEKVYKLPVNLPVTCPNRLNGACGCDFCAEQGTGFEALNPQLSVTEQLKKNIMHINLLLIFKTTRIHFYPLTALKNICGKAQAFRML